MFTANRSSESDVVKRKTSLSHVQTQGSTQRDQRPLSLPGDEFPPAVYQSVLIAFSWMMLSAWMAFGGTTGTDLDLAVATVLCAVFLALPIVMYRSASSRLDRSSQSVERFLVSRVDTWTGLISGREAWLQVILIPAGLALAATLIGGVFVLTS